MKEAVFPATSVNRAIPLPSVRHHNCPIPIYQSNEIVTALFRRLGQPLLVPEEEQLHTIRLPGEVT